MFCGGYAARRKLFGNDTRPQSELFILQTGPVPDRVVSGPTASLCFLNRNFDLF